MRKFAILVAVALCPVAAFAAPVVKIDFGKVDIGLAGQRVQSGFDGVGLGANGNLPATVLTSSAATGSVNYSIAIGNGGSGTAEWRDRGDSTSVDPMLIQVGEDHVKNNAGLLEVTLTGIPAGTYEVRSYHIDADFNNLTDDIQVLVSDAVGSSVNAGVSAPGNLGGAGENALTDALVLSSSLLFQIVSDGSPISLLFDGTNSSTSNIQTPLNGLEITLLQTVPEPASIAIWSLLGLALAVFGYRRYRQVGK